MHKILERYPQFACKRFWNDTPSFWKIHLKWKYLFYGPYSVFYGPRHDPIHVRSLALLHDMHACVLSHDTCTHRLTHIDLCSSASAFACIKFWNDTPPTTFWKIQLKGKCLFYGPYSVFYGPRHWSLLTIQFHVRSLLRRGKKLDLDQLSGIAIGWLVGWLDFPPIIQAHHRYSCVCLYNQVHSVICAVKNK